MTTQVRFAIEADQNDALMLFCTGEFSRKNGRLCMESVTIDAMGIEWEGGVRMPIANVPAGDHFAIVHAKLASQGFATAVYPISDQNVLYRLRPLSEVVEIEEDRDRESLANQSQEWCVDLHREMYAAPTFRSGSELLAAGRDLALT